MRLLVTRPEPDASQLAERIAAAGHDVYIEPMIDISFDTGDEIELDEVQALIATSRNGVRALARSPALEIARHLPLYAVGPGTATAARATGIETVIAGARDARALAAIIAEQAEANGGALLHLAGDQLASGFVDELQSLGLTILQPTVYRSVAADAFSEDLIAALTSGEIEGVLLMSPRTARIFADLLRRHGLSHLAPKLTAFCLSEAVAQQLGDLRNARTFVARAPNLQEILCLVADRAADFGAGR